MLRKSVPSFNSDRERAILFRPHNLCAHSYNGSAQKERGIKISYVKAGRCVEMDKKRRKKIGKSVRQLSQHGKMHASEVSLRDFQGHPKEEKMGTL